MREEVALVTAKEGWEAYVADSRTRCKKMSFGEALELFDSGKSFADIGRVLGVSSKRANYLFHKYFKATVLRRQRERPVPALIDRLRHAYEHTPVKKRRMIPYEELLDMYCNPTLRMADIGERLGVNDRMADALYRKYFMQVIPVVERRRCTNDRNWRLRRERMYDFSREPALKHIAGVAREAGLHVCRIPRKGGGWEMTRHMLSVDGFRCRVHHITTLPPTESTCGGTQRYALIKMAVRRVGEWDAHIVFLDIPEFPRRIMVIPSVAIMRIPWKGALARLSFWVTGVGKKRRKSRHDWSKYEDAWHLLEGE